MMMFRISVKMKEADKRKNATVWRYVVMAETLDEAKALAVAERVGPVDCTRRDDIAAVWGHPMPTLAYNADNYGEKDRSEKLETVPTPDAVRAARAALDAFERAHEPPDDD
jgi:hypothetical protein